jgi:hypothetical protein
MEPASLYGIYKIPADIFPFFKDGMRAVMLFVFESPSLFEAAHMTSARGLTMLAFFHSG